MRLSDDTLPTHLNESSSSASTPAEAISASSDRPRATPPMAIAAASTSNVSNASFPALSDASTASATPIGTRRPRTRTSPVASHLLLSQAHNALTSMRIAPSPNLMFRGDASGMLELAARRRDLSHILSNENLRKLASAYEQMDYSPDVLQFSLPPPADVSVARSLPPTRVSERAGNVAVPAAAAAAARPIVVGSAPSNLSAGFASFDDDDDDDDDDDNDRNGGARRSASVTTGVSFEATREELECSLCFRLFYQPMTSHCGHSFCAPCYHELVRHSNTCALCREPFASTPPGVNVALRGVCAAAFPEEFLARSEEGRREEDELARARSAELARASEPARGGGGNGANARRNDDNDDDGGGINLMSLQGVFCMSLSSLLCSNQEAAAERQNNINNNNINNNNNSSADEAVVEDHN